jgi:hypothetical protein
MARAHPSDFMDSDDKSSGKRKTIQALITEGRYQELKAMLEERRLELVRALYAKIRDVRAENTHEHSCAGRRSGGSVRGPMASVSSAGTRLPNHALERCVCGAVQGLRGKP